jgi:hypothetical protein
VSIDIYGIAHQMDRLRPSDVDRTPRDWGNGHEAGHSGHVRGVEEERDTLGWFRDAGNVGHPVFAIHPHDVGPLHSRLAQLPDGALDQCHLPSHKVFTGMRINWLI